MLSKSTNRAERTCPGCEKSVIEASMVTGGIRRRQPAEERNVLRGRSHGTTLGAETQMLDSNGIFLGSVAAEPGPGDGLARAPWGVRARPRRVSPGDDVSVTLNSLASQAGAGDRPVPARRRSSWM